MFHAHPVTSNGRELVVRGLCRAERTINVLAVCGFVGASFLAHADAEILNRHKVCPLAKSSSVRRRRRQRRCSHLMDLLQTMTLAHDIITKAKRLTSPRPLVPLFQTFEKTKPPWGLPMPSARTRQQGVVDLQQILTSSMRVEFSTCIACRDIGVLEVSGTSNLDVVGSFDADDTDKHNIGFN